MGVWPRTILTFAVAALAASGGSTMLVRTTQCPDGSSPLPSGFCQIGPFIVFFDPGRADITEQAAAILDNMVEQYRATPDPPILLTGHADRSGAEAFNLRLSRRRAEAVRRYLAERAIPAEAMRVAAFGETRLLVKTEDGVPDSQNRRVEVSIGRDAAR